MTRKRRVLFWLAVAGIALAVVSAVAVAVLRSEWFHRQVRARVIHEIEKATGARVEWAGFDFDLREMRIRVRDLVLHGREDPREAPLFRAAGVELNLKLRTLWKPSVDLRSLVLEQPQFHLIVYPDGSTNLPAPPVPRARRRNAVEVMLDLAVDRLNLEEGLVLFEQQRIPLSLRAEQFRFRWSYDLAGPAYEGRFSAESLALTLASWKTIPLACEAGFRLGRQRLELRPVRLRHRGSWWEGTAAVERWESPRFSTRYTAHLRLDELRSALAAPALPARGTVRLEGQAELSAADAWTTGRLRVGGLALDYNGVRIEGIAGTADYAVRREGLEWRNLAMSLWGGRVRGAGRWSNWQELDFTGFSENLALQSVLAATGQRSVPYTARLSGPVRFVARTRGTSLLSWRAKASLDVLPEAGEHALGGRVEAEYDSRTQSLLLAPSYLFTRSTRVEFRGALGKELFVNAQTKDLADLEPWMPREPQSRARAPIRLAAGGAATFRGVIRGPLSNPEVDGHLSLRAFEAEGVNFDSLETEMEASPSWLRLTQLQLRGQQLSASGSVHVGLQNWRASDASALNATLSLRAADASLLLEKLTGQRPVSGALNAGLMLSGTMAAPQFKAHWELRRGLFFEESFERLAGEVSYRDGTLTIRRVEVEAAGGRAKLAGAYRHEKDDPGRGRLSFDLSVQGLGVSDLSIARKALSGAHARVSAQARGEIQVTNRQPALVALAGKATIANLSWQQVALGNITLEASTAGPVLAVTARGKLLGAEIHGESRWNLEKGYEGSGTVKFGRMHISDWLARLGVAGKERETQARPELPVEIVTEGSLNFQVPSLPAQAWKAALELSSVEIAPRGAGPNGAALTLRNQGPWLVVADKEQARIRQARLVGKGSELELSGSWRFVSKYPMDLRCRGAVDLGLLASLDPELRTGGSVQLDATLRGAPVRPDLYGRLEVRNAFVNYGNLPNGLDKLNGVLFLYRDRATIEKLTAESGGGKVNLRGFATFAAVPTYWFQLDATEVRVRYPEGVSSTVDALLTFTGNPAQSVLSGELTVRRAAFHPQTDLGSLLVRSAQRPEPPSHPFLENVRLDVRIRTAPQVRLETSLTRSLQAEADLRLRGSALRPALLGRALISQGEILFFGNRYTIDSGEILFVNPSRIEPVVNLHLATRVRGVEVTLNINGPLSKTTVTYRSDPPLPFSDIVALLATGRTPSTAPGLVGARSEFAQSWEQAGAGALVSQAITSPLAGRLQRFLGVSRLKIDPTVRGIENTPEAHLTLEQQITPDITLVYITNLARAQQQTIRLEWDFTRNFSALAVREANGLFGVDFLYKKRFK